MQPAQLRGYWVKFQVNHDIPYPSSNLVVVNVYLRVQVQCVLPGVDELLGEPRPVTHVVRTTVPLEFGGTHQRATVIGALLSLGPVRMRVTAAVDESPLAARPGHRNGYRC